MATNLTPVCEGCPGRCCTRRFGHGWLRLTEGEARREPFSQYAMTDSEGWLLPFGDKACHFLGGDNLCRIYDRRPQTCREYVCVGDVRQLRETRCFHTNPAHRSLLNRWKTLPGQEYGLAVSEVGEIYLAKPPKIT